jgi:adenylate kinase
MWVVFLGPPGCGKGTQTEFLVGRYGFSVVSPGEILRANLDRELPSGETVKDIMSSGGLLPDSVIVGITEERLREIQSDNILFDGFPRTVGQAEALSELAETFDTEISVVFSFEIDEDSLVKRISGRYSCCRCGRIYNKFFLPPKEEGVCDICGCVDFSQREDDNELSLKKRLLEYHEKTRAVVDFYDKSDILYRVDASAAVPFVSAAVLRALGF